MNGMRLFMLAAALLYGLTLAGCSDKDEGEPWVPTFRLQYIDTEGHNLLPDDVQGVEITITDEGGTVLRAVQNPEILGGWIAFSIPETFNSNSDRKAEKKRYEISVKIPSLFGPDRVERFTVGGAMAFFMHYDEATYNGQPMQRQQVQLENAFDPIRSRPTAVDRPTAVEVSDHGAAPTLYLIIPLQPKKKADLDRSAVLGSYAAFKKIIEGEKIVEGDRAVLRSEHYYDEIRNYKKVGPLLTTEWHQDYPFNRYTPIKGEKHAPAGCVPIAIAQVVNYHQRLDGENIAWNHLKRMEISKK